MADWRFKTPSPLGLATSYRRSDRRVWCRRSFPPSRTRNRRRSPPRCRAAASMRAQLAAGIVAPTQALRLERPGRERGARHARADLGERRFAVRGGIVAEGRETAVVGRPEPVERNVLRRFQDSVPYLFGRLDARVDRIDHADEYPLAGLDVLLHEAQRLAAVGLTRALDVEVRHLQLEERGQEVCVVHVGAVRRVQIAARTGVDADPLPLFGGEALERLVVQVDERREQPLRWIELDREPALREIELHNVGALRQTPADVRLRLAQQI